MDLKGLCTSSFIKRKGLIKILVIMNLATILLLATALQVSASGFGQEVTLTTKDASLQTVFKQIEKQTGYQFFYKEKIVNGTKPVTVQLNKVTLAQALNAILAGQDLSYSIVDKVIVINQIVHPDNALLPPLYNLVPPIDVHGRVVNDKGQPVEGATVTVKGTNKQVSTNANGEFTLTGIDDKATLVVSAVNIETYEIKVAGKTELAINVKAKVTTGETITVEANTGYQTLKPNEITGSVAVIDNKTLNQQTGTNILQRLDKVTTSIYFDVPRVPRGDAATQKTNISIRGLNSVLGTLDPLIVLDNFIYEGNINNINPNDIESVTVLKDAAATSIYGARGGNGVIVITTKKGRFNQKIKVEVNSNVIISKKPDYFALPQMSVNDYINAEEFLFNQGYDFNSSIYVYPLALTPAVQVFQNRMNGIISAADSANQINALKSIDNRAQYNRYFNKTGITSQYSLNITGGSNNIAWLISGNYDKAISNSNTKNERINVKVSNTYKPRKNLLLNFGVYYTNSKSGDKGSLPAFNSVKIGGRDVPYLQFADKNGNALPVDATYLSSYTDTVGGGKLLNWKYYPLENSKHDFSTRINNDIVANIGVSYQVRKWLNLDLKYQYEKQNLSTEHHADIESYYARNLINTFSQLDYSTGIVTYIVPKGGILTIGNGNLKSQNLRGQINVEESWGQHSISALAGGEIRETVTTANDAVYYGYDNDLLTTTPIDPVNSYPTFVFGGAAQIPFGNGLSRTTNRFVSAYANAAYTYRKKYTVYASGRKDGANIFGLTTNNKWTPLWSIGIGWNISKEKFYHIYTWLPALRFRTTYGISGNVDLTRTALPVGASLINPITGYPYIQISTPNNPSLRWEKVRQLNVGIDFSFKKDIITGTFEFYSKKSNDLYGPAFFDYTGFSGLNQITMNIGNLSTKGFDLSLQTKNIDRTFKWQTRFFLSHNTNKLKEYFSSSSQSVASLIDLTNTIIPVVGKPLYAIAAYKWGGLNASGQPQGYVDGQLSTDYFAIQDQASAKGIDGGNMVYIGPSSPTYFGSVINELQWKQISVSFNISYRLGYYFRKSAFSSSSLIESGIGHRDFERRWQKPGDELITNVPAFSYPSNPDADLFYATSEINVDKADHIRLQYINLNYTIERLSKRLNTGRLQLYVNIANLGIVWRANKDNLDPDFPSSLPQTKQFTFGVRASL